MDLISWVTSSNIKKKHVLIWAPRLPPVHTHMLLVLCFDSALQLALPLAKMGVVHASCSFFTTYQVDYMNLQPNNKVCVTVLLR